MSEKKQKKVLGRGLDALLGDSSKAHEKLNWKPKISAQEMCAEMVREDLLNAKKDILLRKEGY